MLNFHGELCNFHGSRFEGADKTRNAGGIWELRATAAINCLSFFTAPLTECQNGGDRGQEQAHFCSHNYFSRRAVSSRYEVSRDMLGMLNARNKIKWPLMHEFSWTFVLANKGNLRIKSASSA